LKSKNDFLNTTLEILKMKRTPNFNDLVAHFQDKNYPIIKPVDTKIILLSSLMEKQGTKDEFDCVLIESSLEFTNRVEHIGDKICLCCPYPDVIEAMKEITANTGIVFTRHKFVKNSSTITGYVVHYPEKAQLS